MKTINTPDHGRLIPVTKWPEYHPWPTVAGLRWLIFHAETNGFHVCVSRKGRRVLIWEQRFFDWVKGNKDAA
jgi:hypothetical protein